MNILQLKFSELLLVTYCFCMFLYICIYSVYVYIEYINNLLVIFVDTEDAPALLGMLDSAFLFAYAIAMFIR